MQKPSKLNLKTQHLLKKARWSEWIKVFNQVHNSTMFTSVGTVQVKINEKENSYTKKSKSRDR